MQRKRNHNRTKIEKPTKVRRNGSSTGVSVTRRRLKIKCRTRVRNEEEVERKRSIARQNDMRLNVRTARRG